jgi:glucose-6-phosphate isomerase
MTANVAPAPARPAWQALDAHARPMGERTLRELFAADPARGERLTAEAVGVYLDYSKQRITDETLRLLVALADECGVAARIGAMFRGEQVNATEHRPALHVALRAPKGASIAVDGENVVPEVHRVLERMADFALRVRGGQWVGHTGARITSIVNIGIGGSDLGPAMAVEALHPLTRGAPAVCFVSNVDGTDLANALEVADPARTLFIIASKTFSTQETLANARTARRGRRPVA